MRPACCLKPYDQASKQIKKKRELENLKSFSLGKAVNTLEGKHVLVVDDVVTTGTTLTTCAKILRDRVFALFMQLL